MFSLISLASAVAGQKGYHVALKPAKRNPNYLEGQVGLGGQDTPIKVLFDTSSKGLAFTVAQALGQDEPLSAYSIHDSWSAERIFSNKG